MGGFVLGVGLWISLVIISVSIGEKNITGHCLMAEKIMVVDCIFAYYLYENIVYYYLLLHFEQRGRSAPPFYVALVIFLSM